VVVSTVVGIDITSGGVTASIGGVTDGSFDDVTDCIGVVTDGGIVTGLADSDCILVTGDVPFTNATATICTGAVMDERIVTGTADSVLLSGVTGRDGVA